MRAVATALVLIIGAAVVLWYGNTLNSWVLGGLIGGLAALLLSIPISLTLFSYFSRRHDDQLKAEVEEEMERAQVYTPPPIVPHRAVRGAYVESYLEDEADFEEDEAYERDYRARPARNLPVPSQQRLPMVNEPSRKLQAAPSQALQRSSNNAVRRQLSEDMSIAHGKANTTRRPTTRQINYPNHPGFEPGSQGSQSPAPQKQRVYQSLQGMQRSAALRSARKEMAQQYDDVEVLPTTPSRRLPPARASQQLASQSSDSISPRTNRQTPAAAPANHYRPRRTIDSTPSRNALPMPGEDTARETQGREPRTDYLNNQHYPRTAPIRQQLPPQTGQIARNPQIEQQPRNPDVITGSLNAPMVRRAPYLYDDDPLLQELEQHIDTPTVRRSSRRDSKHLRDQA